MDYWRDWSVGTNASGRPKHLVSLPGVVLSRIEVMGQVRDHEESRCGGVRPKHEPWQPVWKLYVEVLLPLERPVAWCQQLQSLWSQCEPRFAWSWIHIFQVIGAIFLTAGLTAVEDLIV